MYICVLCKFSPETKRERRLGKVSERKTTRIINRINRLCSSCFWSLVIDQLFLSRLSRFARQATRFRISCVRIIVNDTRNHSELRERGYYVKRNGYSVQWTNTETRGKREQLIPLFASIPERKKKRILPFHNFHRHVQQQQQQQPTELKRPGGSTSFHTIRIWNRSAARA